MSKRKPTNNLNSNRYRNLNLSNLSNSNEENQPMPAPIAPVGPRRHTIYGEEIPAGFLNRRDVKNGDIIVVISEYDQLGRLEYKVVVEDNKKFVKLIYNAASGLEFPDSDDEHKNNEVEVAATAAASNNDSRLGGTTNSQGNNPRFGGRRTSRKARKGSRKARKGSRKVRKARRDRKTRRDRKNRRK